MSRRERIGVMYDRELPPQGLVEFARTVEAAGADELWVVEDLGYAGSVSATTAGLGHGVTEWMAQAAARVRELWAAGADSVVLRPFGHNPVGQVTATLAELR